MSSELLRVAHLGVEWDRTEVLHDVSFSVDAGEYAVLMGPNGSGKTTLLRAVAGLGPRISGRIWFGGRSIETEPPHRRGIGLLFQDPALFPNRSVWENVAYGLEIQRAPAAAVAGRVAELLTLLHLGPLANRRATELSGGERQRVALARSLAPRPRLLLLDEPFASVDPQLRGELRGEFREVLRKAGVAVIHVTHDREEGLFLADRVLLLDAGRILQSGAPQEVFASPRSAQAAAFLGYNVLLGPRGWLAVHPRDIRLETGAGSGLEGEVVQAGDGGNEPIVLLRGPRGERIEARGVSAAGGFRAGRRVRVTWVRGLEVSSEGGTEGAPPAS